VRYAQLSDEAKRLLKAGYDDVLAGRRTDMPLWVFTPEGFDDIQRAEEECDAGGGVPLEEVKRRLGDT